MENVKGNTKSLMVSDDVFSGTWGERSMDKKKLLMQTSSVAFP